MTITSPHNDQLKEIRKLAGRTWRDKLRQFVAEGEDLLAAADAAGWEPQARLVAQGSGLDGEEVQPHLLAQVSQLGSGTRALGPGTADPYGPKAVRASMGALFSVPVARVRSVDELPGRRVALVARAGAPLHELPPDEVSLVVGAEREGLPGDVVAGCDAVAHIPIASESLNAAMAATVGLYEIGRRMARR